ncbi:MAG TPA: sulfotransferase domain-containing protein [Gammaproteobacteria bacterium]|nr:sulfotransferase domain-containing protein [Gammaproteobacteria bacterium]
MRPDARWGEASPLHDPRLLAGFRPRPTDVLITTAPKAGTTWMQQILHQLRSGGDEGFQCIYDVVPWLERPRTDRDWRAQLADYEAMDDPRIFKTHCTYPQTPSPARVRIVLTSRDPRDCCVSFYHHLMDMTDEAVEAKGVRRPASFDDYFERWLAFGSWFRNVQSWWPHFHDPNVLWLRYEDLRRDLAAGLQALEAFLGWPLSPARRERVLEYCSFRWMKDNAWRFTRFPEEPKPLFRPGGFIRRGQVGGYRELLSPRQEARILDRARAMLPEDCLAFLGLDATDP